MTRSPDHPKHAAGFGRHAPRPGVEYEFDKMLISREVSRSLVTRMLVQRADEGGWELDRVRIGQDGTRRVVLRRKIIRQRNPHLMLF